MRMGIYLGKMAKWVPLIFVFIGFFFFGLSSFKKSGHNGQGGQSRINPASLASETSTATVTARAEQNGAQGQPPPQGKSYYCLFLPVCVANLYLKFFSSSIMVAYFTLSFAFCFPVWEFHRLKWTGCTFLLAMMTEF